ncbi:toxin-antitoxin system HicB family antitoxin (plasmid) [Geminicoccaceae bacterium 1502E]|nr:toxin-antitoxin system HicB family antitoxin [Geminicoccaceae bacterium 1502E]
MPGRRGTETRGLSDALMLRMTPQLGAAVRAAAAAEGLSAAAWVRGRLVVLVDDVPRAEARPSPPRVRVRVPPPDLEAMARLLGEVGRAGGAVAQLARMLRDDARRPALDAEAEAVLDALRQAAAGLTSLIGRLEAGSC